MVVAWAITQAKRKKEDDERAAAREAAAEARKAEMLRILAEQVAEKVPNFHPHTDSLHHATAALLLLTRPHFLTKSSDFSPPYPYRK